MTRRCLNWINEALSALTELEASPPAGPGPDTFNALRPGLSAIRDAIKKLRRNISSGGAKH